MVDIITQYSGAITLLSLLFSIPIAILANLITPYVKQGIGRISIQKRKVRIKELEFQLTDCELIKKDQSYAIAKYIGLLLTALLGLFISIIVFLMEIIYLEDKILLGETLVKEALNPLNSESSFIAFIITIILSTAFTYFCFMGTFKLMSITRRIINYSTWKSKVEKEILELKSNISKQ
jgi:hypothetical protein